MLKRLSFVWLIAAFAMCTSFFVSAAPPAGISAAHVYLTQTIGHAAVATAVAAATEHSVALIASGRFGHTRTYEPASMKLTAAELSYASTCALLALYRPGADNIKMPV